MWSTGDKAARGAARRGFTLVELTVVLVILAVVVTMIVPQMAGAVRSTALREQSCQLLVAARHTRDYAVSHRCCCRLAIDTDEGAYSLLRPDEDDDSQFVPLGLGWQKPVKLEYGVTFGPVRIEPSDGRDDESFVCFWPNGEADAAVVQVTGGERTYSLEIAPSTGRAALVEGAVSQVPYDRRDLDVE